MVYKTRKNKRRCKKQSRRMYGGVAPIQPQITSSNNNTESIQTKKGNPPSILSNLKTAADIGVQLGNNIAATGLEFMADGVANVAESVGINPNASVEQEIAKISEKTGQISTALQSKEGQEALKNVGAIVTKVSEDVIGPGITKIADTVIEKTGPIANKMVTAGMDAISATPIGPLIEIPRLFGDLGNIAEQSTSMVSDVLDIGKTTIDESKKSGEGFKGALEDLNSVINKENAIVSDGLKSVKNSVDSYGTNIVNKSIPNVSDMSIQQGGSLKKLHNIAKMIGGRVNKSQLEFMSPSVNIRSQYGGITKRRHNKQKHTTLRRR